MKEVKKLFKKFLEGSQKEGYSHNAINKIVGRKRQVVLTEAEVVAGLNFSRWVQENIGKRYKVVGGETCIFKTKKGLCLIPNDLAQTRLGLNQHLWGNGSYEVL